MRASVSRASVGSSLIATVGPASARSLRASAGNAPSSATTSAATIASERIRKSLRHLRLFRRPHANMKFSKLLLGHRRWGIHQQVLATLCLRKGDHVADLIDA